MAAGIPSPIITKKTQNASSLTTFVSSSCSPMLDAIATTSATALIAATYASQRICWRSTPRERRKRRMTARTQSGTRSPMYPNPTIVCAIAVALSRAGTPVGFGIWRSPA
jgi:hypothetical protein